MMIIIIIVTPYLSILLRSFIKNLALSSSVTWSNLSMICCLSCKPKLRTSTSSCTILLPIAFCMMVVRSRSYVGSFSSAAHLSASSSSMASSLVDCVEFLVNTFMSAGPPQFRDPLAKEVFLALGLLLTDLLIPPHGSMIPSKGAADVIAAAANVLSF